MMVHFQAESFMNDAFFCKYIQNHLNVINKVKYNWINMSKDVDRKTFMVGQFDKYKIQHERFEAVTPSSIEKSYKMRSHNSRVKKTTINEICCLASHLSVMYRELSHSNDYIAILEDDIIFNKLFLNVRNIIINAPTDWEILQLHHVRLDDSYDYTKTLWLPWMRRHFCTTFYIIKRHCAEALVKKYMRFDDAKNVTYDFSSCNDTVQADYYIYKDFKTYTFTRQISQSNLDFASNIQSNQQTFKPFISAFEKNLKTL
jgi:GR25 family glycosyltransferase involved in LPS biosynthesis